MEPDEFVEFVGSQWHDSMRGPLEQLFNIKHRESKLTITKAQRSLRDEDNRRVFQMRMEEARIMIDHMMRLSSSPTIEERLREVYEVLKSIGVEYNAQVRD